MVALVQKGGPPARIITKIGEAAGLRCRWFESGSGAPVVLLPSPLIHGTAYFSLIRQLSGAFHVLVPELPGSGKSARLPRCWSEDEYALWLDDFFRMHGLRSAMVIGHSSSGPIALRFAELRPERVDSLVLADTTGFDPSRSLLRGLLMRGLTAARELHFTAIAAGDLLHNSLFHTRTFVNQLVKSCRAKVSPRARPLDTPTLVAWGLVDRTMRPESLRSLLPRFKRKSIHLERKGDHDWLVEHADSFAAAVLKFSNAVPIRG